MVQSLPQSDSFRILFNSPELSEVQRSGFHLFLKNGIAEELSKISCIQLKHVQFLIEIVMDVQNFRLITPENSYRDCILKMKSYTCQLYVETKILFKDKFSGDLLYQTQPEWVLLADLPIMTKRGHFVINGSPRVIVHQVGRAPGVYFKKVLKAKNDEQNGTFYQTPKPRFYGDIVPRKGVWVRLQINKKGEIDFKLKKSKKVRAEMVQKCLELLEKEESFSSLEKESNRRALWQEKRFDAPIKVHPFNPVIENKYLSVDRKEGVIKETFRQSTVTPTFFDFQTSLFAGIGLNDGSYSKRWQTRAFVIGSSINQSKIVPVSFPDKSASIPMKPTFGPKYALCSTGSRLIQSPQFLSSKTVACNKTLHSFLLTLKKLCFCDASIRLNATVPVIKNLSISYVNGIANKIVGERSTYVHQTTFVEPTVLKPSLPVGKKRYQGNRAVFTKAEKEAFVNVYNSFYKNDRKDIEERVSLATFSVHLNQTNSFKPTLEGMLKRNGTSKRNPKTLSPNILLNARTYPSTNRLLFAKSSLPSKTKSSKKKISKKQIGKKPSAWGNVEKIREYLYQLFKRSDLYDLGLVGREKMNTLFGISVSKTHSKQSFELTALDIKETINWLSKLREGKEEIDDIDHSQNRRVRTSSELIQTQFEVGVTRLKNVVTRKFRTGKVQQIKVLQGVLRKRSSANMTEEVMRAERGDDIPQLTDSMSAQLSNIVHKQSLCRSRFGNTTNLYFDRLHFRGCGGRFIKNNQMIDNVKQDTRKTTFTKTFIPFQCTPFCLTSINPYGTTRQKKSKYNCTYNVGGVSQRLFKSTSRETYDPANINHFRANVFNFVCQKLDLFAKPFLLAKKDIYPLVTRDNRTWLTDRLFMVNTKGLTYNGCIIKKKEVTTYVTKVPLLYAIKHLQNHGQKSAVLKKNVNFCLRFTKPSSVHFVETLSDKHMYAREMKTEAILRSVSANRSTQDALHLPNHERSNISVSDWFSTKPINGALREFFSSSPLSQYMDQTNPLAEITHKRRISSLGIGGVSRESAGMAIRGIHPTHYGRICPIETPEGKNAGLVNSLAFYAKINEQGFIETPYYQVVKGQVQHELGFSFYSARQESQNGLYIAPNDIKQSKHKVLATTTSTVETIPVRVADNLLDLFKKTSPYKVNCIGISPVQILSVATSLIPFLEHNDANRALMGSNMQRQAVSLMISERPVVGTGLEARVLAESGHPVQSKVSGFVSNVSAHKVVVEHLFYNLSSSSTNHSSRKQSDGVFLQDGAVAKWSGDKVNQVQDKALCLSLPIAQRVTFEKRFVKALLLVQSFALQNQVWSVKDKMVDHVKWLPFVTDSSLQRQVQKRDSQINRYIAKPSHVDRAYVRRTHAPKLLEKTYTKNEGFRSQLSYERFGSSGHKAFVPLGYFGSSVFQRKGLTLLPVTHSINTFSRSNQETCLMQKPLVQEGDWVQKGDMVSDCSAGDKGELSVGKNMLIAYIPWQGYNFEDAIVISDRLVREQLYTSLHIERYTVTVNDFKDKVVDTNEWFTGNLPGIDSKKRSHLQKSGLPIIGTLLREGDILVGKIKYSKKKPVTPHEKLVCDILGEHNFSIQNASLYVPKGVHEARVLSYKIKKRFEKSLKNHLRPKGAPQVVYIFLGEKRNIQVGDKMSGRHGNKGIVSTILPKQDMPYLADGSPIDILLNPLGVPSRMNVGQVFECLLGLASTYLHQNIKYTAFDERYGVEASQSLVFLKLYQARLQSGQNWLFQVDFPGKTRLTDGRSGECLDQWVTVGMAYMLKLIHMVNEKIHARAIGPYALVTQQPLKGRAHKGGQRLGEMEVWAVEGFGGAYILQELLTKKSDDSIGRKEVLKAMLPQSGSFLHFLDPFGESTEHRFQLDTMSTHAKKENGLYNEGLDRADQIEDQQKNGGFLHVHQRFGKTKRLPNTVLGQPDIFKVLICELQALCLDVGVYSMKTESFQRKFLGVLVSDTQT